MVVDVMNSALCVNTDSTEFKFFANNMTRGEARMVEGIEINLIAYMLEFVHIDTVYCYLCRKVILLNTTIMHDRRDIAKPLLHPVKKMFFLRG